MYKWFLKLCPGALVEEELLEKQEENEAESVSRRKDFRPNKLEFKKKKKKKEGYWVNCPLRR